MELGMRADEAPIGNVRAPICNVAVPGLDASLPLVFEYRGVPSPHAELDTVGLVSSKVKMSVNGCPARVIFGGPKTPEVSKPSSSTLPVMVTMTGLANAKDEKNNNTEQTAERRVKRTGSRTDFYRQQ